MPKSIVLNLVAASLSIAAIAMSLFVSGCSNQAAEEASSSGASGAGSATETSDPSASSNIATSPQTPAVSNSSGSALVRSSPYGGSARGSSAGRRVASTSIDSQLDNLEQRTNDAERRLNQLIESMPKK